MLVRELKDKGATIAWSPVAKEPNLLALASKEGGGAGFDDYGGELQVISRLIHTGCDWGLGKFRPRAGVASPKPDELSSGGSSVSEFRCLCFCPRNSGLFRVFRRCLHIHCTVCACLMQITRLELGNRVDRVAATIKTS